MNIVRVILASALLATALSIGGCAWIFQKGPQSANAPGDCDDHPVSPTVDGVFTVLNGIGVLSGGIVAASANDPAAKLVYGVSAGVSLLFALLHGGSAYWGSNAAKRCRALKSGRSDRFPTPPQQGVINLAVRPPS